MKIYFKYIVTVLVLIFAFIILQVVILGVVTAKVYGSGERYGKYAISKVYDALPQTISAEGEELQDAVTYLEEMRVSFAMLLDSAGRQVWNYRLPEHLNHDYAVTEVASFTRWYLDDYPVSVWGGDKGLLVIGYPPGSVWNYYVHQNMKDLNGLLTFCSLSFVLTILAASLVLLVSGYRYYRKMRVMTDSIDQLASGGSVHLSESGTMREVATALNRTSDRLSRQRQQLERRDEARTEWISGVSHDIRTPLSLVMGYADLIERQPFVEPEVKKRAALIRRQSIRIRNLIEDLNLASKLEYHMQPLRLKTCSIAVILRRVAADLLNEMEQPEDYPLSIQIEPEFETFTMDADEQLLLRAFQNILGNSIRHNEEGCSLEIRASMVKGRPRIYLRDSGRGIPPAICSYINEGNPPEGEIHIMGLRIVKQIVEAHEGEIRADADGAGIEVRF